MSISFYISSDLKFIELHNISLYVLIILFLEGNIVFYVALGSALSRYDLTGLTACVLLSSLRSLIDSLLCFSVILPF